MVSIDLNTHLPTANPRSKGFQDSPTMRAARHHDIFELLPRRHKSRKVDNPSVWLQTIVDNIAGVPLRNLTEFFAEGLPKIIGADLSQNNFDSFIAGFQAGLTSLGLTGSVPTARQDDTGIRLRASALGVSRHTRVERSVPRAVRRFDELSAQIPPDLPTLQSALDAGASDGLPIGFGESLSALIGAVRAAVLSNDSAALRVVGEDFGALLAALHEVVNGDQASQRSAKGTGHVRVRRATDNRLEVKAVEVDGRFVSTRDVEIDDQGRYVVRHRTQRG